MFLFQSFIGVILSIGFITLLLLVAWYMALPIVLILLAIGLFNLLTGKPVINTNRFADTLNKFRNRPRRETPRRQDEKIIDVDYTELP